EQQFDLQKVLGRNSLSTRFTTILQIVIFQLIIFRMNDNSTFVLQWVINNATSTCTAEKAVSRVFREGGFKWTASFEPRQAYGELAAFYLRCGVDHNGSWKCEADVKYSLLKRGGSKLSYNKERFCFDADNSVYKFKNFQYWVLLRTGNYNINDAFTVEFDVHIISAERGQSIVSPSIFAAPNGRSDVILKIGEKNLHVSKELLALQSPVFEALFFGDFAEKGKEEVEIKDVVYEEFVDLLNVIYLEMSGVTDRTVSHVLKLADRFQMERLLKLSANPR
ncbi:hypothetical protein PMAYCL1PPCAC_27854, partial [Pristionchus mayeri]